MRRTTHKRQTLRTGDSQPSFSGRACADRVLAPRCTFHHERSRHSVRGHKRKPRLMPVSSSVEVVGVKETIKALRQLDPEHRKEFNRGIRGVVAPMVSAAKSAYPQMPISGMARNWSQGASQKFPYQVGKVKTGVKVKTSTRRDTNSVVYISQGTAAGAIFEVVREGNPFGRQVRARNSRVLWPTYDRFAPQILLGVGLIVKKAERTVQGMVDR